MRQSNRSNAQCKDIAADFHHRGGNPALVGNIIRLDPQPGARIVSTPHRAGVTGIHPPGVKIRRPRTVTAVGLHQGRNGREGIGGRGRDGRGKGRCGSTGAGGGTSNGGCRVSVGVLVNVGVGV